MLGELQAMRYFGLCYAAEDIFPRSSTQKYKAFGERASPGAVEGFTHNGHALLERPAGKRAQVGRTALLMAQKMIIIYYLSMTGKKIDGS